jgi:hypothetical protein
MQNDKICRSMQSRQDSYIFHACDNCPRPLQAAKPSWFASMIHACSLSWCLMVGLASCVGTAMPFPSVLQHPAPDAADSPDSENLPYM